MRETPLYKGYFAHWPIRLRFTPSEDELHRRDMRFALLLQHELPFSIASYATGRLTHGTALGDDHLAEIISGADYAISGQVAVGGEVLRAAKRLKLLHKWGVGVDNLDLETARELGIRVARTTGSNSVAVAEFTIGLMVCALRHIPHGHFALQIVSGSASGLHHS